MKTQVLIVVMALALSTTTFTAFPQSFAAFKSTLSTTARALQALFASNDSMATQLVVFKPHSTFFSFGLWRLTTLALPLPKRFNVLALPAPKSRIVLALPAPKMRTVLFLPAPPTNDQLRLPAPIPRLCLPAPPLPAPEQTPKQVGPADAFAFVISVAIGISAYFTGVELCLSFHSGAQKYQIECLVMDVVERSKENNIVGENDEEIQAMGNCGFGLADEPVSANL